MDGKKKLSVIANNGMILGEIMRLSPWMLLGKLSLTVASNLLTPLSSTVLLRYVIDAVSQGRTGNVLLAVALFALFAALVSLASNFFTHCYLPKAERRFCCRLKGYLYEKAAKADLSCYDDPEYYDMLTLSAASAEERFLSVLDSSALFAGRLANLVCVLSVLLAVDWSIAVILALALGVNMAVSGKLADRSYQRGAALNPLQRRERYLSDCFRLGEYAKELRTGGMAARLEELYLANSDGIEAVNQEHGGPIFRLSLFQDAFGSLFLIHGALLLYLIYQCAVAGRITAGDLTAVFNGVVIALEALIYLTSQAPAQLRENGQYIEKYKTFMALEPKVRSGNRTFRAPMVIRFENVSFSYDGRRKALQNISFSWHRGEKIALVGYNGSGKSTLIKLLLRFYDPDEGRITADGVDIREFDLEQYRRGFVTVFQDYQLYAAKLGENLALDSGYDAEKGWLSLIQSGFAASYRAADGETGAALLEREVGQEFTSGLRMSQGQRQQAAVGRVYYRAEAFAVLDEPSAALDPMLEEQLNRQLISAALGKDRGVLLVSHRLSSTVAADRILVMDDGRLAEEGTHRQLMEEGGVYASFFRMQASEYQKG